MKKTIRAIVESTPAKTPGRSVLEMMLDQEEEQVAEMEAPPADEELVAEQEVELADSPAPSADEQIAAAFAAAVTAIVADPALSVEEKKKKIIALLNAEEKVADASATDTAPATESDAEEVPAEEETESAASETVVRKADRGAVVLESIGLLNTAGVPVMESYVEAMASLPNKARRQAFANDLKRSAGTGVEIVARSREGKQVAETASKAKSPKVDFGRNPDLGERALRGMSAVE